MSDSLNVVMLFVIGMILFNSGLCAAIPKSLGSAACGVIPIMSRGRHE